MSVQKIPEAYRFICDVCKAQIEKGQPSRPPYWSDLIVSQDAHDWQGAAVADGTVKRLLCAECTQQVSAVINEWATKRIAEQKP